MRRSQCSTRGSLAVTLVWLVRGETMASTTRGAVANAQQMHCFIDLFTLQYRADGPRWAKMGLLIFLLSERHVPCKRLFATNAKFYDAEILYIT